MPERIPLSVPNLSGRELEYISAAVKENWVSYVGPQVSEFEARLAESVGARDAAVMASGTAALHIALILAGVGPEDEVIMPALSFVAPANAVRYCGAWPVFVDVAEHDWQINVDKVKEFLETACRRQKDGNLLNKSTGRRVHALLPVHLLGGMADVDSLANLAEQFGLWLIEDAAEAMGATYKGRDIGASIGSFIDERRMVCTSFNGNKIITAGGGGALFANAEALTLRARHLSTTAKVDPLEFVHDTVGFNYRMTNLAAALGLAQLEQLPIFVGKKKTVGARYDKAFRSVPGISPHPRQANTDQTFWLYTIRVSGGSRQLMRTLINQGIDVRPLWKRICELTPFSDCAVHGTLPVSLTLSTECLCLPCSTDLTEAQQARVIAAIVLSKS